MRGFEENFSEYYPKQSGFKKEDYEELKNKRVSWYELDLKDAIGTISCFVKKLEEIWVTTKINNHLLYFCANNVEKALNRLAPANRDFIAYDI